MAQKKTGSKSTKPDLVTEPVETKVEDVVEVVTVDDAPAADASEAFDETDKERPVSWSTRGLIAVALLACGGVLALWAGPKIAPSLPAGMAPVAAFLSPSSNQQAELDALRKEFDLKLTVLEGFASNDAVETLRSELGTQITNLSDQMNAVDGTEIEARLAATETSLSGALAQITTITDSLTGTQSDGTGISAEARAQIAGYKSAIEGLKAEVSALSSQQGNLNQKIDDVSVTSERKVNEAQQKLGLLAQEASTAQVGQTISNLSLAVNAGRPFAAELASLQEAGLSFPDELSGLAQEGVPTLASLESGFGPAAIEAIRASIRAEATDGLAERVSGFLKSQVPVRSLEPYEGDSTDAVQSRIGGYLTAGNISAALSEADNLSETAKSAMSGWLTKATLKQNTDQLMAALKAQYGTTE